MEYKNEKLDISINNSTIISVKIVEYTSHNIEGLRKTLQIPFQIHQRLRQPVRAYRRFQCEIFCRPISTQSSRTGNSIKIYYQLTLHFSYVL